MHLDAVSVAEGEKRDAENEGSCVNVRDRDTGILHVRLSDNTLEIVLERVREVVLEAEPVIVFVVVLDSDGPERVCVSLSLKEYVGV